jgi:hypothetical protein
MAQTASVDIWRAANLMLEMYGGDASLKAAMRADALLAEGDADGFFAWKRIMRAIDDLSREQRVPGEPMN